MTIPDTSTPTRGTVLVVGATRGLGLAVARQFLERGWRVVGTARDATSPQLVGPELVNVVQQFPGRASIETLDVTDEAAIAALRERIAPGSLDVLYVNAGTAGDDVPVGQISTEEFARVMVTNALAPMRLVEQIGPLVADGGTIAIVSSRQGSISFNTHGGQEVYRASKAALNQLMRSYAARPDRPRRTLLLLHPGWVQTLLGGTSAPLTVDDSAPGLVDVVEQNLGAEGLQFLDFRGQPVPW